MEQTLTAEKIITDGKLPPYKYTVLFVCTGNTCRSPMAEAIYNSYAKKLGLDRQAFSAGLFADGAQISQHAKTVLEENGLADENFTRKSVMIDDELCRSADAIVGMTEAHAMKLIMTFPQYATKIRTLNRDIPDPFGGYLDDYRKCYDQIDKAIREEFFPELT